MGAEEAPAAAPSSAQGTGADGVTPRGAVFLDRDGTLIEERSYPSTREDVVVLPGVGQALQRLSAAGYLRIVLTNQSAVARGMLTEEELAELHEHMDRQLAVSGGSVDGIYYCPHHPDGSAVGYNHRCACRKPGRGLLDLALLEHPVDLSASIFIGDSPRDLFPEVGPVAARILVETGHPLVDASAADIVMPSVAEAASWILQHFPKATREAEEAEQTEAEPEAVTGSETEAEAVTGPETEAGPEAETGTGAEGPIVVEAAFESDVPVEHEAPGEPVSEEARPDEESPSDAGASDATDEERRDDG